MQDYQKQYDVVICGAGLAGLTLARQLAMYIPNQKVLLIDRLKRPLPEAAHKVGESTVHPGGTYLCNVIHLKEYLDSNQLEKYGLRYFYGNHKDDFATRAEVGRASYDEAILEHQMDRGILENDLREMVTKDGATLAEGASLQDIEIGEGEDDHLIHFKTSEGEEVSVKARWVIDATGRRQFLSRKLDLRQEFPKNCSATWVRVKGRFDVSDLVPLENKAWHDRVSTEHPFLTDFGRYNSTNHIMGYGYWIWIIPLVSGYTSIGIATHNDYHDFSDRNTMEKMMDWLREHDARIAQHIEKFEILDFKKLANYAHTASHVFSVDRWACTGEAGVFSDPFQSPGTDSIAISNCYIKEMIQSDMEGTFNQELVDSLNKEYLDYSRTLTEIIQLSYPGFHSGVTGSLSTMWYLAWSMSFIVPNMRFRIYKDGYISKQGPISKGEYSYIEKINSLGLKLAAFIQEWVITKFKDKQQCEDNFNWLHHWDVPCFKSFRDRMIGQPSPEWELNLQKLMDFGTGIFLLAIEDVYPKVYASLPDNFVPNIWAISMNPDQWERDGLFEVNEANSASDNTSCLEIKEELRQIFFGQLHLEETLV